ncbi:hypothetical protein NC653_022259 [Populus alba x Populus x berolinensis]|uniref:Uncharacterized protein n=1 Tax=Populus alba x Populus x berolinensis TaxID=444605 RepID=A0AAD6MEU0_9ROSI|nr:hypothetical protein NC653_022259 [Populus alba x Populus x berolinensis]
MTKAVASHTSSTVAGISVEGCKPCMAWAKVTARGGVSVIPACNLSSVLRRCGVVT